MTTLVIKLNKMTNLGYDLSLPVVFKFKYQMLKLVVLCINIFGIGWGMLYVISHGIGFGFAVFLTFLTLFLVLVTGVTIAGQSDIVIDDQGISRRFLGKIWRTIRWDNVQIINTFPIVEQGFRSRVIRGFSICPRVKPIGISYLSGKIGFTDGYENMDQLIEVINHYVSKHEIKVEVQAKGVKVPVKHL